MQATGFDSFFAETFHVNKRMVLKAVLLTRPITQIIE